MVPIKLRVLLASPLSLMIFSVPKIKDCRRIYERKTTVLVNVKEMYDNGGSVSEDS